MTQKKHGINPLTIPARHPETGLAMNITVTRLHVQEEGMKIGHHRGDGDPVHTKLMQVMIWVGPAENPKSIIAHVDERVFLDAIGHLFPQGELAEVHLKKQG